MKHLLAIFLSAAFAMPTAADEFAELEQRLQLLNKRKEVQALEMKLVENELKIAESRKNIAKHNKEAAEFEVAAEEERRMLGLPNIEIHAGWIEVLNDTDRRCSATDFLRYTCHRTPSCTFSVNNEVCRLPEEKASRDKPEVGAKPETDDKMANEQSEGKDEKKTDDKEERIILKVNFSCGTQIRNQAIPVGETAYITCK